MPSPNSNAVRDSTSSGFGSQRIYANITINGKNAGKWMFDSVTGDTRLYWVVNGKLRFGTIEDLFLEYTNSFERDLFKVLTVNRDPNTKIPHDPKLKPQITCNNSKITLEDILDVSYHGIRDVWKITLRNGKTVKVTEDHALMCAKSYGKRIEEKTFNENPSVISVDNYDIVDSNPAPFDDNLITFMGLWMADGSYTMNRSRLSGLRISTGDDEQILGWLQSFAGKSFHYISRGDIGLYNVQLANHVYNSYGSVDSYTKRVPKFMFTATDNQISKFIMGYFSGDGSIYKLSNEYGDFYEVSCVSVNRELLEDISILLDRLGIKHNIQSPYKSSKSGYRSKRLFYKLTIRDEPSVRKFVDVVGLIKRFDFKKRELYRRNKKLRPVSIRQIRSIEYVGPQHVYDISVAKTESFVANGILLHNTGADISIISSGLAKQIGLSTKGAGSINVTGVSSQGSAPLVNVQMQIENQPAFATQIAVASSNFNLVARRDMNKVYDVVITAEGAKLSPKGTGAAPANTLPPTLSSSSQLPPLQSFQFTPENIKILVIAIMFVVILGVLV